MKKFIGTVSHFLIVKQSRNTFQNPSTQACEHDARARYEALSDTCGAQLDLVLDCHYNLNHSSLIYHENVSLRQVFKPNIF
ncbi:hypothetical protein FBX97_5108 [Herbaspirillum sp. SJZ107]|nr:hypothetical protein FBX97_5108 [Herbaspirillum sp. SJZ107]